MSKARPFFLLTLLLVASLVRQASAAEPPSATTAARELHIDPGTTGVPLGQARLSVDPLKRTSGKDSLSATYKVEISPFAFKSESGRFSVTLSDADLRRLADGAQVFFTGQAVSQDGGNTSTVQGRATPAADDHNGGEVRLQIEGKKGKLVFHTTYHLAR